MVQGGNFILDPQEQGTQILYGIRNQQDRLWDIPIPQNTPPFSKSLPFKRKNTSSTNKVFHINHISSKNLDSTIQFFKNQDQSTFTPTFSTKSSASNQHKLNVIIRKRQLKKDLVNFLHQSLFSPRPSTLKQALKKNFLTTFPGLTENLVNKHLSPSIATEFGHLRQEKQHLQSTSNFNNTSDSDFFSSQARKNKRHHLCYY